MELTSSKASQEFRLARTQYANESFAFSKSLACVFYFFNLLCVNFNSENVLIFAECCIIVNPPRDVDVKVSFFRRPV